MIIIYIVLNANINKIYLIHKYFCLFSDKIEYKIKLYDVISIYHQVFLFIN